MGRREDEDAVPSNPSARQCPRLTRRDEVCSKTSMAVSTVVVATGN